MDVVQSQAHCASIMREHAKSFFFSTRILPRPKREAVEALYGLFRTADDLADEPGPTVTQRREGLARMKAHVTRVRDRRHNCAEPWFPAVRRAFALFPIDEADALRLIDGCESDLTARRISTFDDLWSYAVCVAGTVGRASMPILGAFDGDSLGRAERLGVAMQYTNVLRDVEEDRQLGRSYLPFDDCPGCDVPEVMRAVASRARDYYAEAAVLARRVPNDGSRLSLLITGDIYGGILDELERRRYDPGLGRAQVGTPQKLLRAARCVAQAYAGFATMR